MTGPGSSSAKSGIPRGPAASGEPVLEDRRLLALIAEGYSAEEVAVKMGYSHSNVRQRLSRLRDGLGLVTLEQLYLYAGQQGWAPPILPYGGGSSSISTQQQKG
jgi:DNA-binding CsgD family transcriptional regulator